MKTLFSLLLTVILWASAFVGIRYGLHAYTPGEVALLRYVVASIAIGLLYWRLPSKTPLRFSDVPYLMMLGVIGIGLYNVALNYGEVIISAGISSFIVGLMPVIAMVLAIFALGERVPARAWWGVGVSLIGMVFIAASGHGAHEHLMGVGEVLIAAFCGATFSVLQKNMLKRYSPIEVTAFSIWVGTLFMVPFAPGVINKLPHAPLSVTLDIIYMGVFPGAIAYASWSFVLSKMDASKAVTALYLLPLITTVMGYVAFHEVPDTLSLIGGIVAVVGAVMVHVLRRSRSNAAV
jgi:drug/metabolite transporter (DMT)-like permease